MSNNPLSISDETLREAMAGALLQTLTPDARDSLIAQAIQHLMTQPMRDDYGRKTAIGVPPLVEAVQRAASVEANRIVNEMLNSNEAFKAKVRVFVEEVVGGMLDDPEFRQPIVEAFVHALSEAMRKQSW